METADINIKQNNQNKVPSQNLIPNNLGQNGNINYDIINDFNPKSADKDNNKDIDIENEFDDIINQYTITNINGDNINIELSGISLLRELEDKWDNIEKKKNNNNNNIIIKENNIIIHSSKNNNANMVNNINVINNKKLKEEARIKNNKKILDQMKNQFKLKLLKQRKDDDNLKSFIDFSNKVIEEMEKYKISNEKIKKDLELEAKDNDDNIEPISNDIKLNNQNIQNLQKNSKYNQYNEDTDRIDYANYDTAPLPESTKKSNRKNRKSFLKSDDEFISSNRNKIPLEFQGNAFACNKMTTIEGLVYETPSVENNNNQQINNYNEISESLVNKMKSVYEDITKANSLDVQICTTSNNNNEMLLSNNNEYMDTNTNLNLNLNTNNNLNEDEAEGVVNFCSPVKNNLNLNINNNLNNKIIPPNTVSSITSLDKDFDNILKNINPKVFSGKKFNNNNKLYFEGFDNDNFDRKSKNSLKGKNNDGEKNEEYFEKLSMEANNNLKLKNKNDGGNSNNYNFNRRVNSTSFGFNRKLIDKKLSMQIEENVQLLNSVMKSEKMNKKKFNEKLKKDMINSNAIKNRTSSFFNTGFTSNMDGMYSDKKIYSINKFDDTINKIYQSNATKIQKIINK